MTAGHRSTAGATASLYLATVAIWGSSWLAIRYQVGVVPEAWSVAYRFGLAALVLAGWLVLRRRSLAVPARWHGWLAVQGLTLFCANFVLFYVAAHDLTSGLLAVVFSTSSVMVAALSALVLRQPVPLRVVGGAVLGVGGLAAVFWPEMQTLGALDAVKAEAIGVSLLATLSFSIGSIINARLQRSAVPLLPATAWSMGYGCLLNIGIAVALGAPLAFDPAPRYILGLVMLAVFASVLAFACYLTLIGRIGPARAAYASVLFPLVALAISTVVEGYQWTSLSVFGVVLVLAGNALVLLRRAERRRTEPKAATG